MRRSESLPEQVYNFSLSQRKLDDFFCEDGDSLPELHHQIAAWLVTPRFLPSHGQTGRNQITSSLRTIHPERGMAARNSFNLGEEPDRRQGKANAVLTHQPCRQTWEDRSSTIPAKLRPE